MELENKKKVRKVLRTSFTKNASELESLLSKSTPDLELMQVFWEIVQEKYEELSIVDSAIFDLLLSADADEEDLLKEKDACDTYRRRYKVMNIRCTKVLQPPSDGNHEASSSVSEEFTQGRRKFKLPVIQFKHFDGNIREWLSFWSQFKKIDEDVNIDLADKVEYLVQATVPGSRARHLVDSFPATGENYTLMIDSLKSRFGREDLQIEVYVRELLKLILKNAVSKNKQDISTLYDNIETQLRALEILGITSDKYSAILFPLIESCLPEELLRVWQRSSVGLCVGNYQITGSRESLNPSPNLSLETRLKALMQFLRNEVENEQRIQLASEGFGLHDMKPIKFETGDDRKRSLQKRDADIPTGADLLNQGQGVRCIFCEGSHESHCCIKAQHFSLEQKKQQIMKSKVCFRCLKGGHQSRKCRVRVSCLVCSKHHVTLMCPDIKSNQSDTKQLKDAEADSPVSNEVNTANYSSTHVFLQTLIVNVKGKNGLQEVRALIDTGSQRSYILRSTAQSLGLSSKSKERINHCLFGGVLSEQTHNIYEVELTQDGYACKFGVLDQLKICSDISPVFPGPWMQELEGLNIKLHDTGPSSVIELLIGSDVAGKLYTGQRYVLNCGLVAVETLLGWTLMGQMPAMKRYSEASLFALSLFVNNTAISNLWELDVLGISEPTKSKSRQEMELAAKEFFTETVEVNDEGRYEVRLPWLEGHPPLPSNYKIAQSRLRNFLRKLDLDLLESYDKVFKEWLQQGIIEMVSGKGSMDGGHYLPHRPVVKESSNTTKIRPVFDSGAKQKDGLSLNQCLERGPNLIEEIPDILTSFRENKIGDRVK